MRNNTHDDAVMEGKDVAVKVYEIGYVLLSSIAKEKVAEQTALLNDVLAKAGAVIIAHEDPEMTLLAYTMTKKIHGANQRFDEGYFGWVKFELGADAIASVKKALDATEGILRYLLMTTVRENIYLGKRAPAYIAGVAGRDAGMIAPEAVIAAPVPPAVSESAVPVAATATPAVSVEDMDKSIDAMVKEA